MKTWKVGHVTVDVWEDGDEPFAPCSIAGCEIPGVWRSSVMGTRCADHAENISGPIVGQHG